MALRDIYERTFDEDIPAETRPTGPCPECGGTVQTNTIETACADCGLVLEDQPIDHGPEWRTFEDQPGDPERTGPPFTPTRHDRGLSSEIGYDHTDAHGTVISVGKRRQVGRLRREQTRGRWTGKAEQNLAHGLTEIRRIVSALDLPTSLRDQACALYRTAAGEDLIRGRSIEAMAAASVYAACRCTGLPRTLDEIDAVSAVSRKRISNAYRVLNRELELPAVPVAPAEYVPRLVSELGLSTEARRRALEIARLASEAGVGNGCRPSGIAAACVYEAAREHGERVTQAALGDLADVTSMTLRAQWEKVRSVLDASRCELVDESDASH
ncbi:transcription initiation factor IIB family protein [Salinirubellus sp. GCM10025818]|uniref:transcription initiation factor IIB n=1 Tax=Salinirubellus TaxID=2162630 RepID=UPI0030D57A21